MRGKLTSVGLPISFKNHDGLSYSDRKQPDKETDTYRQRETKESCKKSIFFSGPTTKALTPPPELRGHPFFRFFCGFP